MEVQKEQTQKSQLKNYSKNYKLYYVTFTVCLSSMVWGMGIGYTSPSIPDINQNPNPFHLTMEEASVVASVFAIGGMIGGLSAGYFLDKLGRKLTLVLSVLPQVIGWLMIVSSTNAVIFGFGRLITGVFFGTSIVSVSTYLAEMTPSKSRGRFVSFQSVFSSLGMLFIYGFGCFLPWTWLSICPIVILTIHMFTLPFIPESPRWLLANGYDKGAKEALMWLQPEEKEENINDELASIKDKFLSNVNSISLKDFKKKRHYKPLFITCSLLIIQVLSGIDYFYFYSVHIFQESHVQHFIMDPRFQTTIVSFFGFLGVLVSFVMIDRFGRRLLLISSSLIMAICMSVLGIFYKLNDDQNQFTVQHLQWLPIVFFLIYQVAYTLGLGPVPSVVMSEIIATNARGKVSGFCCIVLNLFTFIVAKWGMTLSMSDLNQYGVFWIFAFCGYLGTVFIFIVLPETKGKTLEELDKLFS